MQSNTSSTRRSIKPITVIAGAILGMCVIVSPVPEGISPEAWKVFGVTLWMAFWWLSEAVSVSITALLPLIIFPVLGVLISKTQLRPMLIH